MKLLLCILYCGHLCFVLFQMLLSAYLIPLKTADV